MSQQLTGIGEAFIGKLSEVMTKVLDLEPAKYLINWGRLYALWPAHITVACCSAEFGAANGPRYDIERFGVLQAVGSLRQSDLLIVEGTVTRKMAKRLKQVWEQMPAPKWCIAMGSCAISGGIYFDSYNVLRGVDEIIPVDVYVPGCPPRPEALIQGIILLQEKIRRTGVAA